MALGTENISTTLVGTTLGISSRDVGTLCTHPNINRWSRWKPSILRGNGGYDAGRQLIDGMYNAATKHYIINQKTVTWNAGGTQTEHRLILHYPNYFDIGKSISTASPYSWRPFRTYSDYQNGTTINLSTYPKEYALGDFRKYNHLDVKPTLTRTIKYMYGQTAQPINVRVKATNIADYEQKFDGFSPVMRLNPHTNLTTVGNDLYSDYTPKDAWNNSINLPEGLGVLFYGDKLGNVADAKGVTLPAEAIIFNKVMLHCGFNDNFGQLSFANDYVFFIDEADATDPISKDANYEIDVLRNPEMISRQEYLCMRPITSIKSSYVEDNGQYFNLNLKQINFTEVTIGSDTLSSPACIIGRIKFYLNIIDRNEESTLRYSDEYLIPTITLYAGFKDSGGNVSTWENPTTLTTSEYALKVDGYSSTTLKTGNEQLCGIEIMKDLSEDELWKSWLAAKLGKSVASIVNEDYNRLIVKIGLTLSREAGAPTQTTWHGHNSPFSVNHV